VRVHVVRDIGFKRPVRTLTSGVSIGHNGLAALR
jgi:hypothetical protein